MHLRALPIICCRWWVGCEGSRISQHTHTHMHLTLCMWKEHFRSRAWESTPHITTQDCKRTLSTNSPPPSHTKNQQKQPDLDIFTPHQPAPKEELEPVGFFGAGRGLRSAPPSREEKKPEDWNDILNRWYVQYQDFIGITDLKKAQDLVTELSDGLLEAQGERRRLQAEVESLQSQLVDNHQQITKTEQYSQEHMQLFSEARVLNEQLQQVRAEFTEYERKERETFTHLSAAIRDCHERERMQAEQSKYWSIIASVVSAALASVITSINNWVRIREIKEHITTSHQTLLEGYERMQSGILASLDSTLSPTQLHASSAPHMTTSESIEKIMQELNELLSDVKKTLITFTDDAISRLQSAVSIPRVEESNPPHFPHSATSTGVAGGSGGTTGGEVSYARVAAAMMVGAGFGILLTAFFLGALGGSAE